MLQYLVLLGAIVNIAGSFLYIKETFEGKTKPNKMTWIMWSIAPFIATAAALSNGIRWAALPVFISGFVPFLIFLGSLASKKAYWKLERFDYICGLFSALALILWAITKHAEIAIVFAIISDASAGLPTLIKSWKYPDTETVEAYMAGLFSALTSFFALRVFNFSEIAFPIYLVLMCSALIIAGSRSKWKKLTK